MADPLDPRLDSLAEVIVRVGLNLQPGQPLLITDPYELQGVHPETAALGHVLRAAVARLNPDRPDPGTEILPANPTRLRVLIEADDLSGYEALVRAHVRRLEQHLGRGSAFLFLTGTAPGLFAGVPADRLQRFDTVKWRHLGPLIQRLVRGATQWTLVPAPTTDWAAAAGVEVSGLWETVFSALRIERWNLPSGQVEDAPGGRASPLEHWSTHLAALAHHRDTLNSAHHRRIRYTGPGIDLTLALPRPHRWCTAQLATPGGLRFVANLPTEEVFTAPHQNSATGKLRVARPVAHGGEVIDGIELEFQGGRVIRACARSGEDLLHRLLATDPGAARIGEVALIPALQDPSPGIRPTWPSSPPCFHHTLLDENAAPHVALGAAYRFCSRAWWPLALNSSQLHLDLPLDAQVELL
ncbi:Aminopeptidase T [Lacunisphaera limnophila]|uniref:Aminopeptidase T n=1 Tax=Lacunisphaera limnophila TaxID=1838286 RepID=A0A1D8AY05_9BACT|nr:aminopeptidase [Lacunisphaera limnophila]AOS45772.1 Aminopeptidase T [Lacunisphaera limnophila]